MKVQPNKIKSNKRNKLASVFRRAQRNLITESESKGRDPNSRVPGGKYRSEWSCLCIKYLREPFDSESIEGHALFFYTELFGLHDPMRIFHFSPDRYNEEYEEKMRREATAYTARIVALELAAIIAEEESAS